MRKKLIERYWAILIGTSKDSAPYFMVDARRHAFEGLNVPVLFQSKEAAQSLAEQCEEAIVVQVAVREL